MCELVVFCKVFLIGRETLFTTSVYYMIIAFTMVQSLHIIPCI